MLMQFLESFYKAITSNTLLMTCQVQIIAHDGSLVKARGLHPSQVSPIQFVAKFNTYTSSENISVSAIVVISTMWYGRHNSGRLPRTQRNVKRSANGQFILLGDSSLSTRSWHVDL